MGEEAYNNALHTMHMHDRTWRVGGRRRLAWQSRTSWDGFFTVDLSRKNLQDGRRLSYIDKPVGGRNTLIGPSSVGSSFLPSDRQNTS